MKQPNPINDPDSSEHKPKKEIHLSTLPGIFLTPLIFLTLEKKLLPFFSPLLAM